MAGTVLGHGAASEDLAVQKEIRPPSEHCLPTDREREVRLEKDL